MSATETTIKKAHEGHQGNGHGKQRAASHLGVEQGLGVHRGEHQRLQGAALLLPHEHPGRRCHGADGEDLIVKVPEGTVIKDLNPVR